MLPTALEQAIHGLGPEPPLDEPEVDPGHPGRSSAVRRGHRADVTRIGLARRRLSRYHRGTLPVPPSEASETSLGSTRGSVTGSGAHRSSGASSSRLIADGDSVARNAFRIGLRTDTPLPISSSPIAMNAAMNAAMSGMLGTAGVTQELDPNDILEVQDMAAAIARAEMLLASPAPPVAYGGRPDMFEALGRRATDDTAGPATPAPPYASFPTPIPPPLHTPTPLRYVTMPSVLTGAEDDAFYHPVGRMRSLADMTLDGYRPEPTLLVRAATRRKRYSWVMAAALLPLLALAAFAGFASTDSASASSPSSTTIGPRSPAAPAAAAAGKTPLTTTSALSKAQHAPAIAAPPVFDVNSLPTARTSR